jgi:hypothetical protein
MKIRSAISKVFRHIPVPWAVALVFGAFVGTSLLVALLVPQRRNPADECTKQCEPKIGQLVKDMNYPMSAKGQYRQVCECK